MCEHVCPSFVRPSVRRYVNERNAAANRLVILVKVDLPFTTIWLSMSYEVKVKVTELRNMRKGMRICERTISKSVSSAIVRARLNVGICDTTVQYLNLVGDLVEFRRRQICNGQTWGDGMMPLDSERSSLPETCIKCPLSWITWLPRGRQLFTSVEHLVAGSDLKGYLPAICWDILEVVDDHYNIGQYLNLDGPEFSSSFSFDDRSNLAKTTFWRQVQRTVNL